MFRIPILLLAGLLSAPLMEVFSVMWMRIVPAEIDLTANYFVMVVLPMALLLHFIMALVLWKPFESRPRVGGVVYVGAHVITQATMLTLLGNPPFDVALYVLMLLISGGLIQFVFHRYFWCPACAGAV